MRPAAAADEPLLRSVFAATRAKELENVPWTDEQKAAFCDSQFDAQVRHYRSQFPNTAFDVVVIDGCPAGRFYVDRTADEIHVLDIALLPEFRGKGVGRGLLDDLLAEAADTRRPVRLYVEKSNRARRLYDRLGFECREQGDVYDRLEWRAS